MIKRALQKRLWGKHNSSTKHNLSETGFPQRVITTKMQMDKYNEFTKVGNRPQKMDLFLKKNVELS